MRTDNYVDVSRAVVTSDMDLRAVLDMISKTVYENYQKFGAQTEMDLWVQEVFMGYVIVHNCVTARYYMAEYGVDESGNVVMDNVVEVKKTWLPVGGDVMREEKEITMPVYYKFTKSFWGDLF